MSTRPTQDHCFPDGHHGTVVKLLPLTLRAGIRVLARRYPCVHQRFVVSVSFARMSLLAFCRVCLLPPCDSVRFNRTECQTNHCASVVRGLF